MPVINRTGGVLPAVEGDLAQAKKRRKRAQENHCS